MQIRVEVAVMALVGVLAVACSGAEAAAPAPSSPAPARPAATVAVEGRVEPAPLPDLVDVHEPDLVVTGVTPADLAAVRALDGVDYVAAAGRVSATSGDTGLEVLVVDPATFRPVTPEQTALERAVWERLQQGEAVFTHAAGARVEVGLGATLELAGPRGSDVVRVGAYASNGLPPFADVLVPASVGDQLGVEATEFVVAAAQGADPDDLAAAIEALTGGDVVRREKPSEQQAASALSGGRLEAFTYVSVGDGTIQIDPAWVRRNIVTVDLPILGRTRCHRIMVPQLDAALRELVARGLDHLITDYSGCYVPRHMLWDPARGISRHAWGLAFDINVPTNGYGEDPTMDPRIVEVFRRWGFTWGGDFSIPDGMHFELHSIVTPAS